MFTRNQHKCTSDINYRTVSTNQESKHITRTVVCCNHNEKAKIEKATSVNWLNQQDNSFPCRRLSVCFPSAVGDGIFRTKFAGCIKRHIMRMEATGSGGWFVVTHAYTH